MNKKSTGLLLSILGVISLVLITAGVTYAFFSYTKEGSTENVITTGTITFYYDEKEAAGNGINITNALPMSDSDGMALEGNDNMFAFNITSTVTGETSIPYTVTVRKDVDASNIADDKVKLYLTSEDTDGVNYTVTDGVVNTFADLDAPTGITVPAGEKVVFTSTVTSGVSYDTDFVLRMWLAEGTETSTGADYSPLEWRDAAADKNITGTAYYKLSTEEKAKYAAIAYVDNTNKKALTQAEYDALVAAGTDVTAYTAGTQLYPLNGQTFKVTVNVYANAVVVEDGTGSEG